MVRYLYAAWRDWLRDNPEYASVKNKRLFIAAPVTVAVALGWLIGHTVKVVPYPYITAGEGSR